ncbi:Repressor of RNA polymerase III transcription Maf1 [Kalmanozyma brasiliensis GHG001]|uniref:MAF1 protein n=1 Tax=Kalmanozyma brasiliensis (strain GHG001) TaxID=1365824 RepID=V5GF19_KALBG|nr:Repressor of RNA polymerase III transcription Maf1 [Kalmanozyma brasiliensis GHG001]EST04597.1 Repressor of RNA polymerase III transcription Maf1 [Kalmanozyma brasiliensis GHG001]
MKYLEYPELELLSRALTFESAECKVFTRMEAYSCKTVSKEKRLFKNLESSYLRSASTSPPDYLEEALASPFGRLDQASARKTLFLLIATLNVAFPDHDFSEVNPADFRKEMSPAMVLNSLSTTLLSLKTSSNAPRSYSSFPGSFEEPSFALGTAGESPSSVGASASLPPLITHPALSHILDDIMNVSDCEVYTFHPDMDSDPHASAEPEEEGELGDDDTYEDEEYWDDDTTGMRGREDTPRARMHSGRDDDDEAMEDAPMFDEDVYGDGLSGRKGASHSIASIGPDGNMVLSHAGFDGKRMHSMENSSLTSFSSYHDSDFDDGEDDLDGTGAGLLWSTFAFFYNRKMKRILFVSVWSRKNSRFGMPTSSWTYAQPPPVLSASLGAPQSNFGRVLSPQRTQPSSSKKQVTPAASAAAPTLAKRAIARTDSTGSLKRAGRPGHIRTDSGSPAPSQLSPFPHASPRAVRTTDPMENIVIVDGRRAIHSLDAALLSASAPAAANTTAGGSTKSASRMRSKRSSDSSSTFDQKRVKKQSA